MRPLYRLFPQTPGASLLEEGGALWTARVHQGGGRHDNPVVYGALYGSRVPESGLAEYLRAFRVPLVGPRHLTAPDGRRLVLATLDDEPLGPLPDLDDPEELVRRALRPSEVATGRRGRTQALARIIHREGVAGFSWWSTIEASWSNVTLFAERATPALRVVDLEPMDPGHPVVRRAADAVGLAVA